MINGLQSIQKIQVIREEVFTCTVRLVYAAQMERSSSSHPHNTYSITICTHRDHPRRIMQCTKGAETKSKGPFAIIRRRGGPIK